VGAGGLGGRGAMVEQVDGAEPPLLHACEVSASSTRWPRCCAVAMRAPPSRSQRNRQHDQDGPGRLCGHINSSSKLSPKQLQAEPNRPVALTDRDVAALIGLLAVVEGEVLSGEASSHVVARPSSARRDHSPKGPQTRLPGQSTGSNQAPTRGRRGLLIN
jgi:hypothetical protein